MGVLENLPRFGAALLACLPIFAQPAPIRIAGTGAGVAILKILGARYEQLHPGAKVTVFPSLGSTGGIRAVADGRIEIACASRGLSTEEAGLGLAQWTLAQTPFVLAVKRSRQETSLTPAQAAAIYSGGQGTWSNGEPIRVVLRPRSDTAHAQLAAFGPEMEAALARAHAVPGAIVATTDQDCADQLEKSPGALGTLSLGQVLAERRDLKPLGLAGVLPSLETLAKGSYPHATVLRLMVRRSSLGADLSRFLRFLETRPAQDLLRKHGFLPGATAWGLVP